MQAEVCLLCGDRLANELTWHQVFSWRPIVMPVLCDGCRAKFRRHQASVCDCVCCGRHLDSEASLGSYLACHAHASLPQQVVCHDCVHWLDRYPQEIMRHRTLYDYTPEFADWLHRYKYSRDQRLGSVMQLPLAEIYREYPNYQWWVIPSSPDSLAYRGFHPTSYLLQCAHIPHRVLGEYQGDGVRQATKGRHERIHTPHSIELTEETVAYLRQSDKILVFDDLYTTGATLVKAKSLIIEYCGEVAPDIISVSLARDQLDNL